MSTSVAQPVKPAPALPGRRYDHIFFAAYAALMLITVVMGFGPTYYFAGVFRAPLQSRIIHVHAVIFSSWILLLIAQTSLASVRRVDLHKRLGIAGFLLACLMVIAGVAAATDSLVRASLFPGRGAQAFYIVPLSNIFVFAVVMTFAYRLRRDAAAHKRLILIASTALMIAAITRWPVAAVHHRTLAAGFASDMFLLALVIYDLWTLRKVHRATLWAGTFLIVVQLIRLPIGNTAAWQAFAAWVQKISH